MGRQDLIDRLLRERGVKIDAARLGRVDRASYPDGTFPVSSAQELMWLNAQLDPTTPFYNVPIAAELVGPLGDAQLAKLEAAVRALEERHEILRTTYAVVDGAIRQTIHAPTAPTIELTEDISSGEAFAARPFDLEKGPIHRAILVKHAPEKHSFLWVVHHIAIDGWSTATLVSELIALYAGRALPPPALQYVDYAVFENANAKKKKAEHETFWRGYLAGAPAAIPLPRPLPGESAPRTTSGRIESLRAFDDTMRAAKATRFVGLATAIAIVLEKWTASRDLVLGTVHANRDSVDEEAIIGNFVNFVPLRLRIAPSSTLREAVTLTAASMLETQPHRSFPYDRLVTTMNAGATGLYNVAALLQNQSELRQESGKALGDLEAAFSAFGQRRDAVIDIRFVFIESGDSLSIDVELKKGAVSATLAEHLVDHVRMVIDRLGAAPDLCIADLSLAGGVEGRPADPNAFRTGDSLVDLFAQHIGDRLAVSDDTGAMTYRELDAFARRVAGALAARGVRPGDRVALLLGRTRFAVGAILGVLMTGAAYVPLDPAYPEDRIRFVLDDTASKLVITDGTAPVAGPTLALADLGHHPAPKVVIDPALPAYVIYTSGSTGRPKGVLVPHGEVVRLVLATDALYRFGPEDTFSLFHSYAFDFSVWEIWGALAFGGRVHVASYEATRDTEAFRALLSRERVTVLSQTPSAFRQLVATDARIDSPLFLRWIVFGGEALDVASLEPWFTRHGDTKPRLVNMYGITETTVHVTERPLSWADVRAGKGSVIGEPIADMTVHVLDDAMRPCAPGMIGGIYVGGAGVTHGYLGRPDLTADRFVPDPFSVAAGARLYRSGDLARRLGNGELEYLGRGDQQVKIRGFRIELGEIESALSSVPGVAEGAVLARDFDEGKRLVGYVAWDTGATPIDLREALRGRLPEHMVPALWVELDRLPLTPNGKLDRRALPAPDLRLVAGAPLVPPANESEARLLAIFQDALGTTELGVHDDFFRLGGHSLLAIRIVTEAKRQFSVELPLRALYELPNVRALAGRIASAPSSVPLPALVPNPEARGEPFPLTEVQEAYWIGRRTDLDDGGVACHAYFEVESEGMDLDRFRRAWKRLFERHDMLRAVVGDDGLQRIVVDAPMPPIQVVTNVDATRAAMSHRVHDARNGPLFEIQAAHLAAGRLRLFVSIDLLVADAMSLELLSNEAALLYADPDRRLPPLPFTFRDYVLAERAFHSHPLYARAEAYWKARVPTLPAGPDLPLVRNVSEGPPTFTRRESKLDPDSWRRLREHGAAVGLTPSGILMAAYAHVLGGWSRTSRFSIVLTLYNRIPFDDRVTDLVGDFTSLTLCEVETSGAPSFEAHAKRLQTRLVEDLEHRYFGGVKVLREVAATRGSALALPVVFTSVLGTNETRPAVPGVPAAELVYSITQTPQVHIDHQVYDDGEGIAFNWDCVDALFPAGMLDDMFAAYDHFLHVLCNDPAAWTRSLPDLLPAAQREVRARSNQTDAPFTGRLLHELVLGTGDPSTLAVVAGDVRLTRRALEGQAQVLGRKLRDAGAKPNELVAIVAEKGWEQIAGALGVLAAGAAYLPIDAALPQERVDWLLEHARVSRVVTQAHLESRFRWPAHVTRFVPKLGDDGAWDGARLEAAQRETDLAYVIYTSGSTGEPKGVMIDHRGAVNTVLDVNETRRVGPEDRVLALSSMSFDLSVWDIFGVLGAGGAVVLPSRIDAAHWCELVKREGVTIWNTVPALMGLFVDAATSAPSCASSLRLCMMSGDWIPLDLPARIRSLVPHIELVSMGGATEASIWSIAWNIETLDPAWSSVPYGLPMRNQRWFVLNDSLADCPNGVVGELYIGGVGVALGYFGDEGRTRERFLSRAGERIYKTGDLGRYHPDGWIEFLGREDSQVKVQGYRIELGEIEVALERHAEVRAASVAAAGARFDSKRLVGFYVADTEIAADALAEHLIAHVPAYMVPLRFIRVDSIPLSANGKVDRHALLALEGRAATAPDEHDDATTPLEEVVLSLCAEALEVDALSMQENFFERGGDSVRAARLTHRLRELLGAELTLRTIFADPTARAISRALAKDPACIERARIVLDVAADE